MIEKGKLPIIEMTDPQLLLEELEYWVFRHGTTV
jgi:hypothetical protein